MCEQIAAKLADILKQRAVPLDDIAPESAGREFFAQDHRAAADQNRAGRLHASHAVIHRQAIVHAIFWSACPSDRRTSGSTASPGHG